MHQVPPNNSVVFLSFVHVFGKVEFDFAKHTLFGHGRRGVLLYNFKTEFTLLKNWCPINCKPYLKAFLITPVSTVIWQNRFLCVALVFSGAWWWQSPSHKSDAVTQGDIIDIDNLYKVRNLDRIHSLCIMHTLKTSSNLGYSRSQLHIYLTWPCYVTYSSVLGDYREGVSLYRSTRIEEHTKCLHINGHVTDSSLRELRCTGTLTLVHSGPPSRKCLNLELWRNSASMNIKCQVCDKVVSLAKTPPRIRRGHRWRWSVMMWQNQ